MRACVLAAALGIVFTCAPAFADEAPPRAVNPDTTSTTTQPPVEEITTEDDNANTSYWAKGRPRAFLSTTIDAGYLYFRPRVSAGYGQPFHRWIGIDANPQISNRFYAGYAGIRAAMPMVDLRLGAREVRAFSQSYLVPAASYNRVSFESQALGTSGYTSIEGELSGGVPVGPGSFLAVASGSIFTGVPSGVFVYDETLRVILKAPYVWRGRMGYAVRLGVEGKISVGVVADVLGVPGRDQFVFRAGLIASAALSNHIEVLGSLIPPILSPDSIGIAGGDFAQLGIRYRWATGSPPEVVRPDDVP